MSHETDQLISRDQVFNQTGGNVLHVAVLDTRDVLLPPHLGSPHVWSTALHFWVCVQGQSSRRVPSWLLANSGVQWHPPHSPWSTRIPVFTVLDNNRKQRGNWEPTSCTYSQHSAQWNRKSLATVRGATACEGKIKCSFHPINSSSPFSTTLFIVTVFLKE